jgi:hypothetical protein
VASRTGEASTVWEVLHPAFIPVLFSTTFLLLAILFSSETTSHKMLFVIIHSILLHSFFSIVFPAGDTSGQQMVLGQTRRVFDNTVLHGLSGWPMETLSIFIVEMFDGINFQAAISTIFARMLGLDIFYVHLSLVPILWGVFTPIALFLITRSLGENEKVSLLSSFILSAFPYTIYFGAISVPNSIGFIFFLFSLYFMLKYLTSEDSNNTYWMLIFSSFSFLAHYLTGVISFSLLLLAIAFKAYESEKESPSIIQKTSLVLSFFLSASLLPLSFIYLRFFGTTAKPVFTLNKLYEIPLTETVGLALIGELIYAFDVKTIFPIIIGPTIALLYMLFLLYRLKRSVAFNLRTPTYFLFAAFLIILIDYRILKLFMEGLPLNEERLWVFRDFIATPFVALAIYSVIPWLKALQKSISPPNLPLYALKELPRTSILRVSSLLIVLNILIPAALVGWIISSLRVAYPEIAPSLQTTWYELEAVRYIHENTKENYVVIGDIWTVYAGEMIVGVYNPQAYYFAERDKRRIELFANMARDPSPKWMLQAVNETGTDTNVAYFIVTEPRLGTEKFNKIVSQILQQGQLEPFYRSENGKLYVFSYKKG